MYKQLIYMKDLKPKTIMFSETLNQELSKYAQEQEVSESQLIRQAVQDLLQKVQDTKQVQETPIKSVLDKMNEKDSKEALKEMKRLIDKILEKMWKYDSKK